MGETYRVEMADQSQFNRPTGHVYMKKPNQDEAREFTGTLPECLAYIELHEKGYMKRCNTGQET